MRFLVDMGISTSESIVIHLFIFIPSLSPCTQPQAEGGPGEHTKNDIVVHDTNASTNGQAYTHFWT